MRLVGVFILYLFFLLLGGRNNAHASTHNYKVFDLPALNIAKTQHAEKVAADYHYKVAPNVDIIEESIDLINAEEEGDENIIRKHILLARTFLAFSYAFILGHCYKSTSDRLPFCDHLSCIGSPKYIVQRVLRI